MFTPIGFYSSPTTAGAITSAYYTADIWSLTYYNTSVGSYSKNSSTNNVGRYYRGAGQLYVSEALIKNTAMVTAMSGKTVLDFQIEYTVNQNSLVIGTDAPIAVANCNVNWTDTPTTQPDYDTPFNVDTSWSILKTDTITTWTYTTPTGTYNIAKSANQTSLVQDWVNGTTANNGMILQMNNNYYGSFINITGVRFWVSYQ